MPDEELLADLLVRWEDEYNQGRDLSAEDLCRGSPHLAERAAQEIAKLRRIRPAGSTLPIPPPTPPMGPPPPPARPFAGMRFDPKRHHASGGLGDVFVAVDLEVGREVALKRIKPQFADLPGDRARFEREAEITGRLEHPGVVPLYGKGQDADGRPFYAMRFIRGRSLRSAIEEFYKPENAKKEPGGRAVAFRGLLQSFTAACNTVAYAHSRGVIHRDLKPDNMMLGPYGETLVVDWGLAKYVGRDEPHRDAAEESVRPTHALNGEETQAGAVVGTPAFISPEQALGRPDIGPASDVFSLGAMLYQLLTGRPPYQGTMALVDAAAAKFPPPRQVRRDAPRPLEAVCLKAMAFRPEERYVTARDLARDVDRWLADEPTGAYREPWRVRARRWVRRNRTVTAAVAAGVLVALLAGGAGAWWYQREEGARAAQRATRAAATERDVTAALGEAKALAGQAASHRDDPARWEAALTGALSAVKRAEGVLHSGEGTDDLRQRVAEEREALEAADRDRRMIVRLEEARFQRAEAGKEDGFDNAGASALYAKTFREDEPGWDALDVRQAAERINGRAIRDELLAGLADWSNVTADAQERKRLREVLQAADPDPGSLANRWNTALGRKDWDALSRLASDAEMMGQPPARIATFGRNLIVSGRPVEAVALLKEAQERRPDDFWIAFELADACAAT
ncbi:MAG TPA: serine/threonine-protein kinase, partial [Gemmataceae bacterium]|nr:serine/threonine-protein kinase [Gemmataceae bacterium]